MLIIDLPTGSTPAQIRNWKRGIQCSFYFAIYGGVIASPTMVTITFFEPGLRPFLTSIFPPYSESGLFLCIGHAAIFTVQGWMIMVMGIGFCLVLGQLFLGTLICVAMHVSTLKR